MLSRAPHTCPPTFQQAEGRKVKKESENTPPEVPDPISARNHPNQNIGRAPSRGGGLEVVSVWVAVCPAREKMGGGEGLRGKASNFRKVEVLRLPFLPGA